jgi:Small-conductance mechanosensitive channel
MIDHLLANLTTLLTTTGTRIIGAVIILFAGLKIASIIVTKLAESDIFSKVDQTAQSCLKNIISLLLKATVAICAVAVLGVPQLPLAAAIVAVGLAIGLAIQGGLANFAGGFIIKAFKPFATGDYIEAKSYEGTVTEIDLLHTTIITSDGKKVTIPNGALANSPVVNYSSEPKKRIEIPFTVSYKADIDLVKKILLAAAANHSSVINGDENHATSVYVSSHGENGLGLTLRVWCNTPDSEAVKYGLMEDAKKAFDKFNITIPHAQMDVHLDKE